MIHYHCFVFSSGFGDRVNSGIIFRKQIKGKDKGNDKGKDKAGI